MYYKDPSGLYAALGMAPSATQEEIKAANRSPYYVPSGDESDQAFAESFRRAREAHHILSDPESKARYDAIASQFTDAPKFSSGREDGAEWPYGEEIAGDFVGDLIVEIQLAPFPTGDSAMGRSGALRTQRP